MRTDSFVIAWKCWYNDYNSSIIEYSSYDTDLENLPEDGFQAMKLWYANSGSRNLSGTDHYFFSKHPDGIIFGQSNDSIEDISLRYPNAFIKRGKHTTDGMMHRIDYEMNNATKPLINVPPVPTPLPKK